MLNRTESKKDDLPKTELTAAQFHEARAEITTQGVKGLWLVNGGGSIALLAFLRAIWDVDKTLVIISLIGIGFLLVGLSCSLLTQFFRTIPRVAFKKPRTKTRLKKNVGNGKNGFVFGQYCHILQFMFRLYLSFLEWHSL